jgi:methylenetetrahydrofolate dehydrogenase (NADP+)/methenyltetrahydrofolate cyclohydrolase
MNTVIFNGNTYAKKKETKLKERVDELKKRGKIPYLASILVGSNERTEFYLLLKQRAAQKVGIRLDIIRMSTDTPVANVIQTVDDLNKVKNIDGIMVQLPLPSNFSRVDIKKIINNIDNKKDVDGMREDSRFEAPVVRAVKDVIRYAKVNIKDKVVVVGAEGFVGNKLFKKLESDGYFVLGLDAKDDMSKDLKDSNVVISATGKKNLIKGEDIVKDTVVIDVGAPYGDVDATTISEKARFLSPVPGGVGPVTIFKLLENVVIAAEG